MHYLERAFLEADAIRERARRQRATTPQPLFAGSPAPPGLWGPGTSAPGLSGASQQYQANSGWTFAAVRAIASRIAGQPVRVARRRTGKPGAGRKDQPPSEGTSFPGPSPAPPWLKQAAGDSHLEPLPSHPLLEA